MVQTVRVPDGLYERLRRTGQATGKPVEEVLERALTAGLPPSAEDVPSAFQDDLRTLEELADEELWAVWRCTVSPGVASRHQALLDRLAAGALTPGERAELHRFQETLSHRRTCAVTESPWQA